jgi:hypothetical protein
MVQILLSDTSSRVTVSLSATDGEDVSTDTRSPPQKKNSTRVHAHHWKKNYSDARAHGRNFFRKVGCDACLCGSIRPPDTPKGE